MALEHEKGYDLMIKNAVIDWHGYRSFHNRVPTVKYRFGAWYGLELRVSATVKVSIDLIVHHF
jgi:hypothetical protein